MRSETVSAGLAVLLLAACTHGLAHEEQPAVVENPTPESHAELVNVVSTVLHGAPVTIADDALTRDSYLSIERQNRRDASGKQLNGRDLGKPEMFRLLKVGTQCVLVHEGSGTRNTLAATHCRPQTATHE